MQQVYNTGKVKIGLAYQRPLRVEHDADACRLQAALLYCAAMDRRAARARVEEVEPARVSLVERMRRAVRRVTPALPSPQEAAHA